MIQKTLKTFGSVCLLVVLVACSTIGKPTIQHAAIISQITVDVTTREEILDWLGEPNGRTVMMIRGQKHELWTYAYSQVDSNPGMPVPAVGQLDLSSENYAIMQSAGVTIALSEDGIVHGLSRHNF